MNITLYTSTFNAVFFFRLVCQSTAGEFCLKFRLWENCSAKGKWKSSSEENIEILIFFQYSNSMIALHIKVMQIWKWAFGLQSCIKTVSKLGDSKTEKNLKRKDVICESSAPPRGRFTRFDGNNIRDWIFDTANTKLSLKGHQMENTKTVF